RLVAGDDVGEAQVLGDLRRRPLARGPRRGPLPGRQRAQAVDHRREGGAMLGERHVDGGSRLQAASRFTSSLPAPLRAGHTPTVSRLHVRRPPPGGLGDPYPITLSLDGEKVAVLMPGEEASCELPPGRHRLRAHNTLLSRTVMVEGRDGEELRYV